MNQFLLSFEQAIIDAELAAKTAKAQAKADAKAKEEREKLHRRLTRDIERRYRTPDEHAQCGIRWYCRSARDRDRGTYWTHCHACGQALVYTSNPNAKPQVCNGRKP